MKSVAAVAYRPNDDMTIETIDVAGPEEGEVLVEIKATGLCHSDLHALEGKWNYNFGFPGILGHEGAGVVVDVGPGVHGLKPGDHVVPFLPHCGCCAACASGKSNLCDANFVRVPSRFSAKGEYVHPFLGLGTFTNYSVIREISLVKVRSDAPFDQLCYLGCGATTGLGSALFSANVSSGSSVIIFGLGGIGLNIVQGARLAGATTIITVDTNPTKEAMARKMGATEFVNPRAIEGDLIGHLNELTRGGADYTFEAVGNTDLMRTAFETTRNGWGICTVVGIAPDADMLSLPPISLIQGRKLQGTAMGGANGPSDIPKLVDWMMDGKIDLASLITAHMSIDQINDGYDLMKRGEGIRSVITFP